MGGRRDAGQLPVYDLEEVDRCYLCAAVPRAARHGTQRLAIIELSGGGACLLGDERRFREEVMSRRGPCRVVLPGFGELGGELRVRHCGGYRHGNGERVNRVATRFRNLSASDHATLQR